MQDRQSYILYLWFLGNKALLKDFLEIAILHFRNMSLVKSRNYFTEA